MRLGNRALKEDIHVQYIHNQDNVPYTVSIQIVSQYTHHTASM